jgi:hypothetical protein
MHVNVHRTPKYTSVTEAETDNENDTDGEEDFKEYGIV